MLRSCRNSGSFLKRKILTSAVGPSPSILHLLVTANLIHFPCWLDSAIVEGSSAGLKELDALCRPEPEGHDVVEHLGTQRRDRVFNSGRNLSKYLAGNEPVRAPVRGASS